MSGARYIEDEDLPPPPPEQLPDARPPVILPPPPVTGPYIAGIDCSPEAQALRLKRLADLETVFFNGAASMTDRGRAVTFQSRRDVGQAIALLRSQANTCMGGTPGRGRSRVFFVPQVKGL